MHEPLRVVSPPGRGHNTHVIDPLVAQRIQQLRERHGWTQKQLAVKAGVAPNTVGGLEHGRQTRWTQFEKIATALGTTPEAIQRGEGLTPDVHPLLQGLNDEDLRIGKRFHDAETRIHTIVERILVEGTRNRMVMLWTRIARLDERHRARLLQALDTFEKASAEEHAAQEPRKRGNEQ